MNIFQIMPYEIYIKTIIHLGLGEYRWIKTSTTSRFLFHDIHLAFGE